MVNSSAIRLGITMGDPAGIGPEIIARSLPALGRIAECVIIGDRWVFERAARKRGPVNLGGACFVDMGNVGRKSFAFGHVRAQNGRASMEYLDQALALIRQRRIDGIVTCPISKEAIRLAGQPHTGHTEYFSCKARARDAVMMLVNKKLKFGLVTRHIPLMKLGSQLSARRIRSVVLATRKALNEYFHITPGRIVVCGLNPHGSDNGVIGREENAIIRPAIQGLQKKYGHIAGPLGADVAIALAHRGDFDAVVAMYHDQALIPLKLLGDETGVNITLGLGFVRTSPLHGTAFDIAGKGKADPSSLIAAVRLAAECIRNQKRA